jgi:quinol monooxygenase YgiN
MMFMIDTRSMKHNQMHFRAEFIIEKGKIEEYKKLVEEMSKVVKANEPDTINYQFYLNRDETKCIVHETYVNSEDVLAHNNGIASQTILPKIFSVSRINRIDVYGNPSEELQKALTNFTPTDLQSIYWIQSLTIRRYF